MHRSPAQMFWFLTVAFMSTHAVYAQYPSVDSMERLLKQTKDDTVRIETLQNLAREYFGYDTSKSLQYLARSRALAEQTHNLYEIGNCFETEAVMYIQTDRWEKLPLLDTAIRYYQQYLAQPRSKHEIDQARLSIATCRGEMGDVDGKRGKYKEAIAAYLEALTAWQQYDGNERYEAIATYYSNISNVYYDLKELDKCLEYDKAAIPYRLKGSTDDRLAQGYILVSDDYVTLSNMDSALAYSKLARPLVEKLNKPSLSAAYYSKTALIYRKLKQYPRAIEYYKKAITLDRSIGNPFAEATAARGMGLTYIDIGRFDSARKALLAGLEIAGQHGYRKEILEGTQGLANLEDKAKHPAEAYSWLKQADKIRDSLKAEESKAAIAEIETRYQTAEKEKSILQLQKDKEIQTLSLKQKSTLNMILFISLGGLLLLGVLLWLNYRQKQQLKDRQISDLEKDKQLMAVSAMLKGQEEERTRLARDLHDGLGGMLSGVKYSLTNIKGNMVVTADNVAIYERSLDMIDSSIRELRRVAHNMMPEMLTRFGMDEALKDYCNSLATAGVLSVRYQSFGMTERLDNSTEIIIYRIVQELLNNTLKHAAATE
ncbi:MAG TPA: tetratricopeptide repeat protein, partial [Puia sp.]|nr:tetratricopeptide repeat protein [Puia sp.]